MREGRAFLVGEQLQLGPRWSVQGPWALRPLSPQPCLARLFIAKDCPQSHSPQASTDSWLLSDQSL